MCTPAINPTCARSGAATSVTPTRAPWESIWSSTATRPKSPKTATRVLVVTVTLRRAGQTESRMEPRSAPLIHPPQLKMSPCPQRVETSRPRGHVSITRLTAVWTTRHTGHSPSWTLCCYREAATDPSPPSTPAARQVTLLPRAQELSPPLLPFRKVLLTDGTHATAAWTRSHQSSVITSRLSEVSLGGTYRRLGILGLFFHVVAQTFCTIVNLVLNIFAWRPQLSYWLFIGNVASFICCCEAWLGLAYSLYISLQWVIGTVMCLASFRCVA